MDIDLEKLKDGLQVERQQLAERLNEIDNKLASIETVLDLLKEQHTETNKSQRLLLNINQISTNFKDLTFKKAVNAMLKENPSKWWAPKDIFENLIKGGFQSNSKDFKNTARTQLMFMRKKEEVRTTETKRGYLYAYKELDSVPHMAETESNVDNGGLPESVKGTDL